jgi:hypothetical protein
VDGDEQNGQQQKAQRQDQVVLKVGGANPDQ